LLKKLDKDPRGYCIAFNQNVLLRYFIRLKMILGIAKKTAIMLTVLMGDFGPFSNASQLCSYAGLTSVIR
jgi:hypothetical protein